MDRGRGTAKEATPKLTSPDGGGGHSPAEQAEVKEELEGAEIPQAVREIHPYMGMEHRGVEHQGAVEDSGGNAEPVPAQEPPAEDLGAKAEPELQVVESVPSVTVSEAPATVEKVGGKAAETAPAESEKSELPPAVCPTEGKTRKANKSKVLDFAALSRAKRTQKDGKPHVPEAGKISESWLRLMLPSTNDGAWWEVPADAKGYRIKLRWRDGGKKPVYAFARLGKRELEELLKETYEDQKRLISSRLFRELRFANRRDVAVRIAPYLESNQVHRGANSRG